ncbi:FMN-binding protein, partial [Enterococcus faecalis]|nr:FMN-binding protein [Enterococcus faecalis]
TDTNEIDNGATLKDGTYSLKEKKDSNGYHTSFSLTVKEGKVIESNYDNVNADGKSNKDDTEYESKMKDVAGVGQKEYNETLNK